ncbi:MAG: protein kinase, partial [Planctomycetota bacterium]
MPDKGPAEYQLLGELFTRASQLAPAEMQRMLCDVARDAPELHADLVRLLQEDECIDTAADPFHDVASLNAHPSVNTSALIPERIGQFEIVRKIAEGGMGAVYEAVRTGEYEQRVAIKLLKQGCNRQELVRRFADEVQFLAVLGEHTKIAGLLDAGTTQAGIPYLVMQFVDGEAIDRYCDRHRLTVQQRLDLFLDACDA